MVMGGVKMVRIFSSTMILRLSLGSYRDRQEHWWVGEERVNHNCVMQRVPCLFAAQLQQDGVLQQHQAPTVTLASTQHHKLFGCMLL